MASGKLSELDGVGELKAGEVEARHPIHYTGSVYFGPMTNWQPNGKEGHWEFTTGTTYVGPMKDGLPHGDGVMQFQGQNAGKFRGRFENGRAVDFPEEVFCDNPDPYRHNCYEDLSEEEKKSLNAHGGRYLFPDNLEHVANMWRFCDGDDRRFYAEAAAGELAGLTREKKTAEDPPREIPDGLYDSGEGFYDPVSRIVIDYDSGEFIRRLDSDEHEFVTRCCRSSQSMLIKSTRQEFLDKIPQRQQELQATASEADTEQRNALHILRWAMEPHTSTRTAQNMDVDKE